MKSIKREISDVCDDPTRVLQMLRTINVPIIGSLEADICSPAHFLADYFNATLITWNCPQVRIKIRYDSSCVH